MLKLTISKTVKLWKELWTSHVWQYITHSSGIGLGCHQWHLKPYMSSFKSCKFQGLNHFLWILANFQSFWKIFPVSPVFTVAAYFHEKLGKIRNESALTVFWKVLELWMRFLTVPTMPELDMYILSCDFSKFPATLVVHCLVFTVTVTLMKNLG